MAHTPAHPISQETVAAISDRYDEPDWMREMRQQAWARYQSLPWPHRRQEAWRRTPIQRYPLDRLRLVIPASDSAPSVNSGPELPTCWQRNLIPDHQVSGTLIHYNGVKTHSSLRRQDQANGVILEGLHQALGLQALPNSGVPPQDIPLVRRGALTEAKQRTQQNLSDLIRQHWMRGAMTGSDFNKFTAMNVALWHGGTFVYVPRNVRVFRPLQSLVAYDAQGGSGFHHTLIIAERGSHVSIIQDRVSQEQQPEVNVEVVEIYAEEGAWVRYVSLQHWGDQRFSMGVYNAELQRDANLLWVSSTMGGRMSKAFMRSGLNAPGARALMYGQTVGTGCRHVDQSTYQHHRAPDTYSDLLFRNVLHDQSHTVFYGMIRVEPEAVGAEGYQANNNLLLSRGSDQASPHANAIPGLEIRCNDVRCSHGATLSHIDPEQRFYLQSRGIPQQEADRLIVSGFLQPIIENVPLAHLRERLQDEITRKQAPVSPRSPALRS
jgi:Fe-S cluster assembly protein SufD